MKRIAQVVRCMLKVLEYVPFMGVEFRVNNIMGKIFRLESQGVREEARHFRQNAIAVTPPSKSGPLWRSEGEDLLYHKKDYAGALLAFENALKVIDNSSLFLHTLTREDRVYGGAAQAALKVGKREVAKQYCDAFSQSFYDIEKFVKDKSKLKWHYEVLAWLLTELGDAPTGGANEAPTND